jgi:hypothetical protein
LSKTKRTIIYEEKKKEAEPPAHKKRREQEARLRDVVRHGRDRDDEYDDIETFERFSQRRSS